MLISPDTEPGDKKMSFIEPFKGVLYNPAAGLAIDKVVAPPYDMISSEGQKALYERDEHNIIRLILGYRKPDDSEADNRYTRASAVLKKWMADNVLIRDAEPAIYVYDQEYSISRGQRLTRRGFISLALLEELGGGSIYPHERTLSSPKEDRLKLMLACGANFSQIFSFYDDPAGEIDQAIADARPPHPRFDFTDDAGVSHTLYALTDTQAIGRVKNGMENKTLFIADGHHRYETALNYRNIMRKRTGRSGPSPYDYVMMYFANMSDSGLTILPFHRLISLPADMKTVEVISRLRTVGRLEKVAGGPGGEIELAGLLEKIGGSKQRQHRFGIYAPPDSYIFTYEISVPPKEDAAGLVESLDVSVLHRVILENVLQGSLDQTEIAYLTDEREITEKMADGSYDMAFLLNPTGVGQVRDIASSGLRMPPKSTNFHPKLISGLVINVF